MSTHSSNIISIPTSFGEIFDRLSILQIKKQFIQDEIRRSYVIFEYDEISRILDDYKMECPPELFEKLININTQIWHNMDLLRKDETKLSNWKHIYDETLYLNDVRFAIKNDINVALNSTIREMKGYEGVLK